MSDADVPVIDKLAEALVKALGEMPSIVKNKTANMGTFSVTYADLDSVLEAVRPILAKHGLGMVQEVGSAERGVAVTTIIVHESGQSMRFGPLVMPGGNTAQTTGSAITYARRYAAMAALGLAPEDDDGAAASVTPARPRQQSRKSETPPDAPAQSLRVVGDDDEIHEMRVLLAEGIAASNPRKAKFMGWVRDAHATNKVEALTPDQVRSASEAVFA